MTPSGCPSVLEECQKVRIELVLMRVGDPVGRAGIHDELGIFDDPGRSSAGGINRYDLVAIAVDNKRRHIDFLQI